MTENRPPTWRLAARWAILAGLSCAACAYVARNLLPGVSFRTPAILIPLATGGLLVLAGALANLGWIAAILRGRKFLIGVNVWAMVLLSVTLLAIANAIVAVTPQTDGWFLDVTRNRIHTLSDQTRNILGGLDRDVRITVLLGSGEVSVGYGTTMNLTQRVEDLMRLYATAGPRVKTETLLFYEDKTRADAFAARFKGKADPDSLVIESGERNVQLRFRDLVEAAPTGFAPPGSEDLPAFRGEEKITSAILSLAEEKQSVVYFITGHGEFAPEGGGGKALNRFTTELRRDNYRVDTLNLLTKGEIPADCSVLVIAGPVTAYQPGEALLLRKHLEAGGKLLLLVRPRAAKGSLEGLEMLLSDFNIDAVDKEVVIEVYRDLRGGVVGDVKVYVQDYAKHPITDDLLSMTCFLQGACPVRPLMPEPPQGAMAMRNMPASPFIAVELFRSSADSWGESNLSAAEIKFEAGQDTKGPLSLALAVTRRPLPAPAKDDAGTRIVAVGTTTIAADPLLNQYEANRIFLMNAINWLAKKESKLGIPPSKPDRNELQAGPMELKLILLITVILMPLASVFAGLMVWWARRRE
jgi:hypothetical protein